MFASLAAHHTEAWYMQVQKHLCEMAHLRWMPEITSGGTELLTEPGTPKHKMSEHRNLKFLANRGALISPKSSSPLKREIWGFFYLL